MKTKSLVTLEAELSKLWSANSVGVLDRDERGVFYLNEPVKGMFSAREGFVTHPTRRPKRRAHLVVVGVAVSSFFAVFVTFQVPKNVHGAKPPTGSSISSPAIPSCLVDWVSLRPMEQDSMSLGSTELTLLRDIVIGGVRQQTIATSCGGAHANFSVTFIKQGSDWKEKGAIPVESHP